MNFQLPHFFVFTALNALFLLIVCSTVHDAESATAHPCNRKCVSGQEPMVCNYTFTLENYYTMTKACHNCPKNLTDCYRADCVLGAGYDRNVITVNRQIPGPSIEVCENDLIVVDVENELITDSTTIHWHGERVVDNPYMDGVPFVTQCPILPRTSFRYIFKAIQVGTHMWHSHHGVQRSDGVYGPLVIRVPQEEDAQRTKYDFDLSEHIITLIDYDMMSAVDKFLYHHNGVGDDKPLTILVNGYGKGKEFVDEGDNSTSYTPLARFYVDQGYRYRFRIINAGFLNCPIEFSVDGHTIMVIGSDGRDIEPVEVDSLVTYAGERFDIVLIANQTPDVYWIRFKGLVNCDERYKSAFQVGVLEYSGYSQEDEKGFPDSVPTYENSERGGKQINPLNMGTEADGSHISMPELSSLLEWDESLKDVPDMQIFLSYDFYAINNSHFYRSGYEYDEVKPLEKFLTPQINHITLKIPSFPLLPQRDEIPENIFCNENTLSDINCTSTFCECYHAYEVPLNAVVELVIIDEGSFCDANHPMHLHGYGFRVVSMEKLGTNITVEQVKEMDAVGLIKRNLKDAPVKDTVAVPSGGYTIVRFHASSPGYWIFHCHLEFHAELGMALLFKVGEHSEMLPVPDDFPRCGNYVLNDRWEMRLSLKMLRNKTRKPAFGFK